MLGNLDGNEVPEEKTVETVHANVMKRYSVKNTHYHKTSPVLNT